MEKQKWELSEEGDTKKFVITFDKKQRKEINKDGVVTVVIRRFSTGRIFCDMMPGRYEVNPEGSDSLFRKVE